MRTRVCSVEPSIQLTNDVAIRGCSTCTVNLKQVSPELQRRRWQAPSSGRRASRAQGSHPKLHPIMPVGGSCKAGAHAGTANASRLHSPRVLRTVHHSRRAWLRVSHPTAPTALRTAHAASISAFFLSASLVTSSVTVVARAWISFICRNTSSLDMPGPALEGGR